MAGTYGPQASGNSRAVTSYSNGCGPATAQRLRYNLTLLSRSYSRRHATYNGTATLLTPNCGRYATATRSRTPASPKRRQTVFSLIGRTNCANFLYCRPQTAISLAYRLRANTENRRTFWSPYA